MTWTRERNPEIFTEVDEALEQPEITKYNLPLSERILVVGTNAEVRDWKEIHRAEHEGEQVDFASSIYKFWEQFLGSSNLKDFDSLTLPKRVITTGFMRAEVHFRETVPVADQLKEICTVLDVPLVFIPPTHV